MAKIHGLNQEKRPTNVSHFSWQGAEYVNQTFGDELNFEIEELDFIYESVVEESTALSSGLVT